MGYVGVRFRPRGAHRRDLGPEPSNTARTGTTYGQVEPLAARPRGYPCSRRAGGRWPEGSGARVGYATYPNNVPQRKQRGVGRFSNCLPRCVLIQSGRPDSNRRPPAPKAGALPDCATPRRYVLQLLTPPSPRPPVHTGHGIGHVSEPKMPRARPARAVASRPALQPASYPHRHPYSD